MSIDRLAGGDVWVDLVPEAHLVLTMKYPPESQPQELSLSGPFGFSASRELGNPEYLFDGLQPGHYEVYTYLSGPGSHSGVPRATIELGAGETRRLTLDLNPAVSKQRISVRGTVSVDPSWGKDFESPRLGFLESTPPDKRYAKVHYTEELTIDSSLNADGSYTWDAGRLPVGKHFVLVEPFGWGADFEVAEPAKPIALSVSSRVHCNVRLLDAETREELNSESIFWHFGPEKLGTEIELRTIQRAKDGKHFTFDAPRGQITIGAHVEGFGWRSSGEQVQSTPAELTIALEPESRIRVRLKDGERVVPFPEGTWPIALHLDGSFESVSMEQSADSVTLSFERSGMYEIKLSAVAGYQQPASIKVEARPREVAEVLFQLVR